MSEQLAVKDSALPVVPMDVAWGAENIAQEDVLIPRLSLAQDLSEAVKLGKCRPGAIVDSSTGEPVVGPGEKLEIIPIYTYLDWMIFDIEGSRKKYRGRVRLTKENSGWSAEGYEEGKPVERIRCLNFFVLSPKKMDGMPFLVTFKKASMQAGRKLSTHFYNSGLTKTTPAAKTFLLSGLQKSKDGYTYQIFNVEPNRPSSIEEVAKAYQWYQMLSANDVQIIGEEND